MTDELAQPADVHAERAVLDAVLQDPRAYADLTLSPEDFYDPRHADIWRACGKAHRAVGHVDPVTVMNHLPEKARPYLVELYGASPGGAGSAGYYNRIVADKAVLRRLVDAGRQIVQRGLAAGVDASEVAEDCRGVLDAAAAAAGSSRAVPIGDRIFDTVDRLELPVATVSSPWPDVDRLTGGLRRGALYVIAARPGEGKSVLGANIARHIATDGAGVAFSSLEMSEDEIHRRLMSSFGTVNLGRLVTGDLTDDDLQAAARSGVGLSELPLYIDDRSSVRVSDIRGHARDVARKSEGLGGVVVDYLQLVGAPRGSGRETRERQVADISRGLKLLARELDVPVIAMAQLNRQSAARGDKRPTLTDLRESGAIEADADGVLLLHHDPDEPGLVTVILAKNRHGPTGSVDLLWQPHFARAVQVYRPRAAS